MANLEAFIQKTGVTQPSWLRVLPARAVTLGRAAEHSEWAIPWDEQISRKHAVLSWDECSGNLLVQVCPQARNPVWFQGQKFVAGHEFLVQAPGEFFIGATRFLVTPTPEVEKDIIERTCAREELRQLSYVDAGMRIDILSALPGLIAQSRDDEFMDQIVQVLLQGVPRAHTALLVRIDTATASPTSPAEVMHTARRPAAPPVCNVSRRLVFAAVRKNRQTNLHRWGPNADSDSSLNNQSIAATQWAICSPLTADTTPGWALYVAGAESDSLSPSGPSLQQLQDSDIKFVGTVAELISSLWALRTLQKSQSILGSLISPRLRQLLARPEIEELLKPRATEVTVLCCDLRGSCRIAEEGEAHLQITYDRVMAALEEMTTRIAEHDGIISDFQGDAAMSFWGWPSPQEKDAEQAARAALAISRGFALLSARPGNLLTGMACGLGLASGSGIAGRLGTMDQFKIGVFGPTINLASRLESLTKLFRVPVLADETTVERLKGIENVRTRRLAQVQPFGISKRLMLYEIMPQPMADVPTLSENQRLNYEAGLQGFLDGDWKLAEQLLCKLRHDGPSLYLRSFMIDRGMRPPKDWDGTIVLTGK
jgi:adenylate cyclase